MLNDSEARKNLWVNLVAGVILALIVLPLLNYVSAFVVSLSQDVSQGLSNQIYRGAALGLRDRTEVLLITLVGGAYFFGGLLYIAFALGPQSRVMIASLDIALSDDQRRGRG